MGLLELVNSPPSMVDDYQEFNTKNILFGKFIKLPNEYIGLITVTVIKSYSIENIRSQNNYSNNNNKIDNNEWTKFFDELFLKYPDYTYKDLCKLLKHTMKTKNNNEDVYPTFEYVVAAAMYAYKSQNPELLTRLHNTFGRPLKLECKKAWLDNWSLNGPGNALNIIFWKDYDSIDRISYCEYYKSIYCKIYKEQINGSSNNNNNFDINNEPIEGSGNVKKFNSKNILTHRYIYNNYNDPMILKIVGIFRTFLIINHLLPNADYEINDLNDIIEVSVKYFPIYYIGSVACNWFDDNNTASIKTIKRFISKYPNTYVVCIVNTASSENSGGAHWMGMCFINKGDRQNIKNYCYLMCSQGSSWDAFMDNGCLNRMIIDNGFVQVHNSKCCQYDNCNCGVYSFLFIYMFILNKANLENAIQAVGVDANNLKNYSKNNIDDKMIYHVKEILFGYK